MCDIKAITDAISTLGIPIVLLGAMLYGVVLAARWFAPRIDKWVDEYMTLQEDKYKMLQRSTEDCQRLQRASLAAITNLNKLLEQKLNG